MRRDRDARDATFVAKPADHIDVVRAAAAAVPRDDQPHVEVNRLNPGTGSPAVVHCTGGPAHDPAELPGAAVALLEALREVLGFGRDDVAEFRPDPVVQRTSGGAQVVHLQQTFRGVPVFQMRRTVTFDRHGRAVRVKGDNVAVPSDLAVEPAVDVVAAVRRAAADVAGAEGRREGDEPIELPAGWSPSAPAGVAPPGHPTVIDASPFTAASARLVVFPTRRGDAPLAGLAWEVDLVAPADGDSYTVVVDAAGDGGVLVRTQRTHRAATGSVYLRDAGATRADGVGFPPTQPQLRPPILPADDIRGDWCADASTSGKNVHCVFESADPQPVHGTRCGEDVTFVPVEPLGDDQLVVNAFYFCNFLHDVFERLGFDRAAGNFEQGAAAPGDAEGLAVEVIARPAQTFGIASFLPSFDPPTLRLGRHPDTQRHTALDFTVVAHEYSHGVAFRLVGGVDDGSGLVHPQSKGISEGLADFFAFTLADRRRQAGEPPVTGIGCWLKGDDVGLRRHRYDQPYPGGFGDLGTEDYERPHDVGEVWCATLLAVLAAMATPLGDDQATWTCWTVVVDALKKVESNPSFLDMRDAMLEALEDLEVDADEVGATLTSAQRAAAEQAMWQAFAHFGMGANAVCHNAYLDRTTIRADDTVKPG